MFESFFSDKDLDVLVVALCDPENQPHQWMENSEELLQELVNALVVYSPPQVLRNLTWFTDECGDYWRAELWCGNRRLGYTGNYYSVDGDLQRLPRDEQEQFIKDNYIVVDSENDDVVLN